MCAEDGVQILGGYGYMHDYGQEKRMRDAKQVQAIFGPHAVKQMDILTRKLGKAV
jgi:alkylation response protein AidB-like acyl-CoA dehydrogenase